MAETRQRYPQGCPRRAVITGAGQLPARYVIHAVGRSGTADTSVKPSSSPVPMRRVSPWPWRSSVTVWPFRRGAYGYPVALAAQTALRTVIAFLREHQQPLCVRFVPTVERILPTLPR